MKYHALYNTMAGHGDAKARVEKLSSIYGKELCPHSVSDISYRDFINSIDEDDAIIICGGDGTINRFVNDTYDMEFPNDVLYYPAGSGNDFMRDVEQTSEKPFSIKKYLRDLPSVEVEGKTYKFVNNVGFGIDGYCCEVGDNMKKISAKPINYTAIAIKGLLFHYNSTNAVVTVDGKEYSYKKVWLAPTMKGRFYGGGMMASPAQDRTAEDGKISVMIFHSGGRLAILAAFPSIFKGEHVKKKNLVTIHAGYDISVRFDAPSTVQIDGETITGVTEYHATARPRNYDAPAAQYAEAGAAN